MRPVGAEKNRWSKTMDRALSIEHLVAMNSGLYPLRRDQGSLFWAPSLEVHTWVSLLKRLAG